MKARNGLERTARGCQPRINNLSQRANLGGGLATHVACKIQNVEMRGSLNEFHAASLKYCNENQQTLQSRFQSLVSSHSIIGFTSREINGLEEEGNLRSTYRIGEESIPARSTSAHL